MLWGGSKGGLEVRTSADGSTVLRGRFPYAIPTVLSDGREKRREVFEARAFGASVADGGDIHLLVHHDMNKPLASQGGDYVKRSSGGVIRVVRSADLIEISAVTKPAYPAAQIEARNWTPDHAVKPRTNAAQRWRA